MGSSAEGVSNADVTGTVHSGAGHPAVKLVGRVGALLVQHRIAFGVQAELIPAHSAAPSSGINGMDRNQGFVVAEIAIDEALHDLVALRIEADCGVGLRHAAGQLAVAEIVVRRHRNLDSLGEPGLRRVVPIDVKLVRVDSVVLQNLPQLAAAGGHQDIGSAGGRQTLAVQVGVIEEIHALHDDALLRGIPALEHGGAVDHAGMLLNDVVAGAAGNIIAIGPDRGAGIVGEQLPPEFVAVIRPQRVAALAQRVAHGVGLVGTAGDAIEDRHDEEPAVRQLVVAHHGIAIVALLARAAKAFEDRVGGYRAVEDLALLGKDRHARIDNLHDVVGSGRQAVVGGIAARRRALWTFKADAESVETFDRRRSGPGTR